MLTITATLLLFAAVPQGPGSVVVNEFAYDDSGTDDREYVELYNASGAPVDISGWLLDSEDPFGPNTAYTVDPGTVLQPGDFWVMGSAVVPNVDQVVGTTNIWENSNESLTLRDIGGAVIDTLVYEANKGLWPGALAEGEGVWGNFVSINGIETAWARGRDGFDTDDNGNDFRLMPWTPGVSNDVESLFPYLADFDADTVGANPMHWGGSWVPPTIIDPTVVDAANRYAIPASPQGGNAVVFWDPSGGGNSTMLLTDVASDLVLETWVYFEATATLTGEFQMWSIGLQGTTGTYYNLPDPSGALGFTANGNTGVNWTYALTETGGVLYLVDQNNGGWGTAAITAPTVLGQIVIEAGVNDGWQRLRLQVSDGAVEGRFGGGYGMNDGLSIAGAISGSVGGVYVGYREFVSDNSTARPPTLDMLWIEHAGSDLTVSGDGGPGGTLVFDLVGSSPDTRTMLLLSPVRGNFTQPLGRLGSIDFGVMQPMVPVGMGLTDATGAASRSIRVPPFNRPEVTLYAQAMSVDLLVPGRHGVPHPMLLTVMSDVEGFLFGASRSDY